MIGLENLKVDFNYREWFDDDNPNLKDFDHLEATFGGNESTIVVIYNKNGIFNNNTLNLISNLTRDLEKVKSTTRVDSITNYKWMFPKGNDIEVESFFPEDKQFTIDFINQRKKLILSEEVLRGYLINDAGDTSVIYVRMAPAHKIAPDYVGIVNEVREIIKKYKQAGIEIHISGDIPLNSGFQEASEKDLILIFPLVALVIGLCLFLMLRNVKAVALVFLIILFTIISVLGFAGIFNIKLNNVTIMVPQFMMAITVSIVIHILMTYLLYLRRGFSKDEALNLTFKKNLKPTILTTLTTAVGFLSFLSAEIPAIFMMGVLSAFGTIMAWVFTYTILYPILLKTSFVEQREVKSGGVEKIDHLATIVTDFIFRFKKIIVIGTLIIGSLSLYLGSKVETNSDLLKYFDEDFYLTVSNKFIEKNLGGVFGAEIIIDSGESGGITEPKYLGQIEKFQNYLSDLSYISKVASIIDTLKITNRALNKGNNLFYKLPDSKEKIAQLLLFYSMGPSGDDLGERIALDSDITRLSIIWNIHSANEAMKNVQKIEEKGRSLGLNVKVTGKGFLWQSIIAPIVQSFVKSLSIAVFLISIFLMIGLRSFKLGLIALIPNVLPLIFGAAVVFILGETLNVGTVIVSSIVLGIAVDDTVHFLSNYFDGLKQNKSQKIIIQEILSHTSPALISTTVVLAMSYGMCMIASFVPIRIFGVLVAIILSFALIIDLIFLPALLMIFDKYRTR